MYEKDVITGKTEYITSINFTFAVKYATTTSQYHILNYADGLEIW